MKNQKGSVPMIVGAVVLAVLLVGFGIWKYSKKATVITPVTTTTSIDKTATSSQIYKDGTYTADGNYISPGGAEQIKVTLVLKDGIVVDASAVALATRPESVKMQTVFVVGFKTQVVGKKLDEVSVTKVSGSSLTPKGFADALVKIKTQAKI